MADTQVLGTCASACGFKSHLPHQLDFKFLRINHLNLSSKAVLVRFMT